MKIKNLFLLWWHWNTFKKAYETVDADEKQLTKEAVELRLRLLKQTEEFRNGLLTAFRIYGLLTQNSKDLKKDIDSLDNFLN